MTTITLKNEIGLDFIEDIKALVKTKPKDFYTIKEYGTLGFDKAIKEIENGDVVSFESVDEAIKYLDDENLVCKVF